MLTFACGPYFSTAGLWASLFILLVAKPATYFAFIQAFRYRVNRAIPMSFTRAILLTGARTLIGAVLLGVVAGLAAVLPRGAFFGGAWNEIALWGLLGVERLGLWLALGLFVGLKTRRLIGWTISGVCLDIAYDVAVGVSLGDKWLIHVAILAAVVVFIALLHKIGRRDALRSRFAAVPRCSSCDYDLTGNLSGICPECGTAIAPPAPATSQKAA